MAAAKFRGGNRFADTDGAPRNRMRACSHTRWQWLDGHLSRRHAPYGCGQRQWQRQRQQRLQQQQHGSRSDRLAVASAVAVEAAQVAMDALVVGQSTLLLPRWPMATWQSARPTNLAMNPGFLC